MSNWLNMISPDIRLVGNSREKRTWLEPLRVIYDHELVLLNGDGFVFEIGSEKISCPDEYFIIVPPGIRQTASFTSASSGQRYWIHFDWVYQGPRDDTPIITYLPGKPQSRLFRYKPDFVPDGIMHGPIRSPDKILKLYHNIFDLHHSSSQHDSLIARARMLELLAELFSKSDTARPIKAAPHDLPGQTRQLLTQLADLPIADMPPLQAHLEKTGYSYAHLCRNFKTAYGIAPLQYITALRIERAKRLISQTSLSLSQVARETGFDSAAYFCRQFRKHTGQSPSQYARNM